MVKNCVYSLFSSPLLKFKDSGSFGFKEEKHLWLSLSLSIFYARKTFDSILLYTDDYGADKAKIFSLPVEIVRVDFSTLPACLWNIGKIKVISMQKEPFIHVDSDVYLTKRLPQNILNYPVLVQSKETFSSFSFYKATLNWVLSNAAIGKTDLFKYGLSENITHAYNCGIIGGTAVEFLVSYAKSAIDFVSSNLQFFKSRPVDSNLSTLIEQWLLAVHEYKDNCTVQCLLDSNENLSLPNKYGYKHYLASYKRRLEGYTRIEQVSKRLTPFVFSSIENYFKSEQR